MHARPRPHLSKLLHLQLEHGVQRAYKTQVPHPPAQAPQLLKDGNEVWSQEVERIFVEGLRKYWESPWATYSRGRSRWRNQFMVDHLKKHGIERSKKQVASHIQVLRNMWRGEPEFHLVAGGEELFQENGLLASPKLTEGTASPEASPPANLDSPDWRSSWSSSASSAPDFSAFPLNFGASTSAQRLSPPAHTMAVHHSDPALPSFVSGTDFATVTPASIARPRSSSVNLEPLSLGPALFNLPQSTLPDTPDFTFMPQTLPPPNRLCNINLWTDSSPMCLIDVDKLTTSASTASSASGQRPPPFRILLRLHLKYPPNDVHSPLAFQGFHAMVSFALPWASSAKCHTKTWAGKTCTSHEVGLLEQLNPQQPQAMLPGGAVPSSMPIAHLPQSALSRCRWLEPMVQSISQQIVVDTDVLAVILYTIDRSAGAADAPAVELVGFHKYPWRSAATHSLWHPRPSRL
ncbi:uncharacterized protein B0H18DRAFT_1114635 [Fomitopsis serialis]|uniref:uncharacterized protein n=1 Tax=Fomitopsis serialis TaxID=139415 RepID=UPI0020082C55|nr:uncharacterized protein B0H18DRAFT_1114635 [Neoantrodia serialis]KAH9934777.1 hypothetical protein B0H18DRAFT_1114635 [Neoantrodia serialis]